jgi:hypothetical protein
MVSLVTIRDSLMRLVQSCKETLTHKTGGRMHSYHLNLVSLFPSCFVNWQKVF